MADTETEDKTWNYLERLEQRAQLRKIRRTPLLTQETDESQPEREEDGLL
jgi:hypothetical protein